MFKYMTGDNFKGRVDRLHTPTAGIIYWRKEGKKGWRSELRMHVSGENGRSLPLLYIHIDHHYPIL